MFKRRAAMAALLSTSIALPAAADARIQIRAVGSSTVYPLAKAVAEHMARANPKAGVSDHRIDRHRRRNEAVLRRYRQALSRHCKRFARIKASETKLCAANGVKEITEIQIGMHGLARAMAKGGQLTGLSQRDVYMALAKNPFGKPNRSKT